MTFFCNGTRYCSVSRSLFSGVTAIMTIPAGELGRSAYSQVPQTRTRRYFPSQTILCSSFPILLLFCRSSASAPDHNLIDVAIEIADFQRGGFAAPVREL